MQEYLKTENVRVVFVFDGNGGLLDAGAEGVFSVTGLPEEIAQAMPARVGATKLTPPAQLLASLTKSRLRVIENLCKERAAAAWSAEVAANKPSVEVLNLDAVQ